MVDIFTGRGTRLGLDYERVDICGVVRGLLLVIRLSVSSTCGWHKTRSFSLSNRGSGG